MFCAFEGKPNILRIYGKARSIHPQDQEWNQWNQLFPNYISARQILVVSIKRVQTSCGFGVPLYEYKGQRDQLKKWAEVKGTDGVQEYKEQHNLESIDGLDTGIFFKDE